MVGGPTGTEHRDPEVSLGPCSGTGEQNSLRRVNVRERPEQDCALLCARKNWSLSLGRDGVPGRGWKEEVPLPHPTTGMALVCSLQVLP